MLEKTRGIFLYQIKYSDSASIAHIYTEHSGRIAVFIRRSKNKKTSSKKNTLQPLFLIDIQLNIKKNREIQNVNEFNIAPVQISIPFNIAKRSIVFFLAEILSKVLKEEEANPGLFSFLYNSIELLDHLEAGFSNFHLVFLFELTRYLGFYPSDNYSEINCYFNLREGCFMDKPDAPEITLDKLLSSALNYLKIKSFALLNEIHLNRHDRQKLIEVLLKYYNYHMPGMGQIKSLEILNEIYNTI